jgi:threonine synthase
MAQMLTHISGDKPVTILTATSGDTGAAVAHAFYGLKNVRVVILYPKGKISPLQEKLFCTLGGNIETVAIDGDFDACQALVKQAFDDEELKVALGLNSANSINISRLLAQICYYFEAVAQLPQEARNQLVISVPSGNFGDLTAGLLAKSLGLPVKRFIAATNANDTVPRFLKDGKWAPNATQATLSNAMDVSQPNNWPRVEELFRRKIWRLGDLGYAAVTDETTKETMRELKAVGYTSEPHAAIAYRALRDQLNPGEYGLFLGTAHPAKFKESVEAILGETLPLPKELAERADLPLLSHELPADFAALRKLMMTRVIVLPGGGYALPGLQRRPNRRPGKAKPPPGFFVEKLRRKKQEKAEIPNKCGHLAFRIAENNIPRSPRVLSLHRPTLGKKNKESPDVYTETCTHRAFTDAGRSHGGSGI